MAEDKQAPGQRPPINLHDTIDYAQIRQQHEEYAERIRPLVCDTAVLLAQAMAQGKRILFEGAQGTMLDVDHGTYPFVTSSSAAVQAELHIGTGPSRPPKSMVSSAYTKAYIRASVLGRSRRKVLTAGDTVCAARATEFRSVLTASGRAAADGSMCLCCATPRW